LLAAGAQADAQTPDGDTRLHAAVTETDTRTAVDLVDHGADLFVRNRNGATPLGLALGAQFFQRARLLIDRQRRVGRVPVPSGDFLVHAHTHPEVAEAFARDTAARADGTGRLVSLVDAIELEQVDLVRESVQAGARLHGSQVATMSLIAAVNDPQARVDRVRALLAAEVDPGLTDPHGRTPLELARCHGRREMFEVLGGHLTGDEPTDALARGVHDLVIVDTEAFTVLFNPNTLSLSIEQRPSGVEEGRSTPTVQDFVDGPHAAAEQQRLESAGAGWLVPLLRRLARGERVRIAEIEYAGGASAAERPVARAFDGSAVPRDQTWKDPSSPRRRKRAVRT
jgi:hypothetical protein